MGVCFTELCKGLEALGPVFFIKTMKRKEKSMQDFEDMFIGDKTTQGVKW